MMVNNIEKTYADFLNYFKENKNTSQLDILEEDSIYFDFYRPVSFFFYDFWIDIYFFRTFDGYEYINISSECERKRRVVNTIRKFNKNIDIKYSKIDY